MVRVYNKGDNKKITPPQKKEKTIFKKKEREVKKNIDHDKQKKLSIL